MCQVLTLLQLAVAEALRNFVSVFSIDAPALFVHFDCYGVEHSYYFAWSVCPLCLSSSHGWARCHASTHACISLRGAALHRVCVVWARLTLDTSGRPPEIQHEVVRLTKQGSLWTRVL